MARRKLIQKLCDRCPATIEEVEEGKGLSDDENPTQVLLHVEAQALGIEDPVHFEDLCDKCKKRCHDLVVQLGLLKEENGDSESESESEEEEEPEEEPEAEEPTPRGRGKNKNKKDKEDDQ